MAYNGFFPTGYNTGYNPYQMQYQQPMQAAQQAYTPQNFSQPTIRAEIVQIDGDEPEAQNFPVQTGSTQMMINKSGTKIFIKTVYANNQTNLDVFVKQPHTTVPTQPDFENFVTKEELEKRLAMIAPQPKKKREETTDEQQLI